MGKTEKIILASGSPRRKDILRKHGIEPVIIKPDVDENIPETMRDLGIEVKVMFLALQKALAVYDRINSSIEIDSKSGSDGSGQASIESGLKSGSDGSGQIFADLPRFILAADTIVYKDTMIGKPKDEDDAFAILSKLRNTSHYVYSGVALIDRETEEKTLLFDITEVLFKDYPDEEIWRYIREEKPFDKSGSYAIQSSWGQNIDRWDGDIENVMGLPWYRIEPFVVSY